MSENGTDIPAQGPEQTPDLAERVKAFTAELITKAEEVKVRLLAQHTIEATDQETKHPPEVSPEARRTFELIAGLEAGFNKILPRDLASGEVKLGTEATQPKLEYLAEKIPQPVLALLTTFEKLAKDLFTLVQEHSRNPNFGNPRENDPEGRVVGWEEMRLLGEFLVFQSRLVRDLLITGAPDVTKIRASQREELHTEQFQESQKSDGLRTALGVTGETIGYTLVASRGIKKLHKLLEEGSAEELCNYVLRLLDCNLQEFSNSLGQYHTLFEYPEVIDEDDAAFRKQFLLKMQLLKTMVALHTNQLTGQVLQAAEKKSPKT